MKRYCVMAVNRTGKLVVRHDIDNPSTAVNKWLSLNRRYPMMVGILCGSISDCMALYSDFVANHGKYYNKYWYGKNFPYGYIEMRDMCNKYLLKLYNIPFAGNLNDYDVVPGFKPGLM